MLKSATKRQAQVLDFVRQYILDHGYSPTFEEIGAALGINSTNCVSGHLVALENKGYLVRRPGVPRSIALTRALPWAAPVEPVAEEAAPALVKLWQEVALAFGEVEEAARGEGLRGGSVARMSCALVELRRALNIPAPYAEEMP